jgi:hypothetical protein
MVLHRFGDPWQGFYRPALLLTGWEVECKKTGCVFFPENFLEILLDKPEKRI